MKLLLFPLIFLVVFTLLSGLGLGSSNWVFSSGGFGTYNGYFDENGHQVCYENLTKTGEAGKIIIRSSGQLNVPFWDNGTQYIVYSTPDMGAADPEFQIDALSVFGFIGIISGGIIFAGVVGARLLTFGLSEEAVSAIWKGTLLIFVWTALSLTAYGMITSIAVAGPIFYVFLTLIYALGIINQVGHPGED